MRRRDRVTGRREAGSFIALPKVVLDSDNFIRLSPRAVKLLIDLYCVYNGNNNGDFCAAWSLMKSRGWRSESTLRESLIELQHYRLIMLTRQGSKRRPSLYGVTFQAIDACDGKLDISSTAAPPGDWRDRVADWERPNRKKSRFCTTAAGVKRYAGGGQN
jgi:hypothetical protein